jgi:hypothetical protein
MAIVLCSTRNSQKPQRGGTFPHDTAAYAAPLGVGRLCWTYSINMARPQRFWVLASRHCVETLTNPCFEVPNTESGMDTFFVVPSPAMVE